MNVIFLPIIIFFGFFALLVGGFIFIVIKLVLKSKGSYWKGEVIDKVHNTKRVEHNRIENFYYLVVKTEEGKEMKVGLSAMMFDKFQKGDIIEKPKGQLFPQKVQ